MTWERFEGRVTMYLAMAIWIHLTHDIWYGLFGIVIIIFAVFAAWFFTPSRLDHLTRNHTRI